MGNRLFGVNISGIINKAIGPGVLAATLAKKEATSRATSTGGLRPSTTNYTCRGFVDRTNRERLGAGNESSRVQSGDVVIIVLGDSLPPNIVPAIGDQLTIENKVHEIIDVMGRDPAAATYTLRARGQ